MSKILNLEVAGRTYAETTKTSVEWALRGESRTLIFANVHVVMEAFDNPRFRSSLHAVDLINPDGMPLVWALRALGASDATRVYGPSATTEILRAAEKEGISVGFYGASPDTLVKLIAEVRKRFPNLIVGFTMSPPFRSLTEEEDAEITAQIITSGVRMLFVGLGCPKQERWVAAHRGRIPAVMFAVGAAFDFLAGSKPQAPSWMMRSGLEWSFRLASEPRRLAMRYLKHNPRFVVLFLAQLLGQQFGWLWFK